MNKPGALGALTLVAFVTWQHVLAAQPRAEGNVTVYKSPSCTCCARWAKYLRDAGWAVIVLDVENMSEIKQKFRIPNGVRACHTSIVDRYVIEGHVPTAALHRLLTERPALLGIGVRGMPLSSPGMRSHNGDREPYEVLAFDGAGRLKVFSRSARD